MPAESRPNIVVLYADDLGFGDLGCYGARSIATPHLDRLAREGLRFNHGYATAATCTPSRYSLLTGSYPWRNPRAAILPGDAPSLLPGSFPTLPRRLQGAGYRTGIVGKWHLGLGSGAIDWNGPIEETPNEAGFDHSLIMAATNDRVPCVYIRDHRVENLDPADPIEVSYAAENPYPEMPTGRHDPENLAMRHSHGHDGTIVNGVGRIGYMRGGKKALWNDETMGEVFLDEAKKFVRENKDRPFFLYYAFHQPHVPRIPSPKYRGATALGPRGDVIAELDGLVGAFLDELGRLGLRENTLVIFSSDNGPVIDDGYEDRAVELKGDHRAAGPLRGGKYSLFDGGTRVPLLLSWPNMVEPGVTDALVSQLDFHATFAAPAQAELAPGEAPDSLDLRAAFLGRDPVGRDALVTEGTQQKTLVRKGNWIFIPPYAGPAVAKHTQTETGCANVDQLYDTRADIGQERNLAGENPGKVEELKALLASVKGAILPSS